MYLSRKILVQSFGIQFVEKLCYFFYHPPLMEKYYFFLILQPYKQKVSCKVSWHGKNMSLLWLWGVDWKFHHKGNCLASPVLPSDAKQLPSWWNFQLAPNNHYGFFFLHTLPSIIAFRLKYVLFYQSWAKIATSAVKKCWILTPTYDKVFGGKQCQNSCYNMKKMSRRHAWELSSARYFLTLVNNA